MRKYHFCGKIAGFFTGLVCTGNFIGALLASLLGHFLFDYKELSRTNSGEAELLDDHTPSFKANILQSLLTISVFYLLKTKNKILLADINTIKSFFIEKFRFDMNDIVLIEKNLINLMNTPDKIDIKSVCLAVNQNSPYDEKVNIVELLFILSSNSNNQCDFSIISRIGDFLNIKKLDFNLIRSRFCDFTEYYNILELKPDASLKDLKKAYRKLAALNHPDTARENYDKEKFQKIVEAYNYLMEHKAAGI